MTSLTQSRIQESIIKDRSRWVGKVNLRVGEKVGHDDGTQIHKESRRC